MPNYVNYICPQFFRTHVNFQRVPTVDTSNPFIALDIPSADESYVVIRFARPKGIDFPYLLSMLHDRSCHGRTSSSCRAEDGAGNAAYLHTAHPAADSGTTPGLSGAGTASAAADGATAIPPSFRARADPRSAVPSQPLREHPEH